MKSTYQKPDRGCAAQASSVKMSHHVASRGDGVESVSGISRYGDWATGGTIEGTSMKGPARYVIPGRSLLMVDVPGGGLRIPGEGLISESHKHFKIPGTGPLSLRAWTSTRGSLGRLSSLKPSFRTRQASL